MANIDIIIQAIKSFNIMADGNLYKVAGGAWFLIVAAQVYLSKKGKTKGWDSKFNLRSYEVNNKLYNQQINSSINKRKY